ncbi:MAG: transketolase-like TK C-terminal-containing protein, partial [Leuconostoc fallax]
SITVGEDGPTHQPIEQLMGLRMIPGVDVLRPGSAQEIAAAWRQALRSTQRPTILILSRGTIGNETTAEQAENIIQHGAGIVETDDQPVVNLIATGTEVQLAMQVKQQLADQHITSRVVSMPNLNRYLELDEKDQAAIIDEQAKKDVVIEAGNTLGWQSVVGKDGLIFGIDQFGASAQPNAMMVDFGLTATHISQRIMESLQ